LRSWVGANYVSKAEDEPLLRSWVGANYVSKAGDESLTGVKTFTKSVILSEAPLLSSLTESRLAMLDANKKLASSKYSESILNPLAGIPSEGTQGYALAWNANPVGLGKMELRNYRGPGSSGWYFQTWSAQDPVTKLFTLESTIKMESTGLDEVVALRSWVGANYVSTTSAEIFGSVRVYPKTPETFSDGTNFLEFNPNTASNFAVWRLFPVLSNGVGGLAFRLFGKVDGFNSSQNTFEMFGKDLGARASVWPYTRTNGQSLVNHVTLVTQVLNRSSVLFVRKNDQDQTVPEYQYASAIEMQVQGNGCARLVGGQVRNQNGDTISNTFSIDLLTLSGTFAAQNDPSAALFYMTNTTTFLRNNVEIISSVPQLSLRRIDGATTTKWDINIIPADDVKNGNDLGFYYNGVYAADINKTASDQRIKDDIRPLNRDHSLAKIINMNLYSFVFKDRPRRRAIGALAQEMLHINPHCVGQVPYRTDSDDLIYNMSYTDMFVHNIAATQCLYQQLEQQKTKMQEQNRLLTQQQTQINQLEAELAEIRAMLRGHAAPLNPLP
jgi:hypothetical protein